MMKVTFKNGSEVECPPVSDNVTRGARSKHITHLPMKSNNRLSKMNEKALRIIKNWGG